MTIILTIGVLLLFIFILCVLWALPHSKRAKETTQTILAGFRYGLKQCGLNIAKKKCPVELWKWETMEDEDVCSDCLERASWPPMDIADWMKEGMPRTPEADTECGENCRCELVRYKPASLFRKHHTKQE